MDLSLDSIKASLGNIPLTGRDDSLAMELTDALQVQVGVALLSLGLRESFPGRLKVGFSLGQGEFRLPLVKANQQLTSFDLVSQVNQDFLDRARHLIADSYLFPAAQGTDHLNRAFDFTNLNRLSANRHHLLGGSLGRGLLRLVTSATDTSTKNKAASENEPWDERAM